MNKVLDATNRIILRQTVLEIFIKKTENLLVLPLMALHVVVLNLEHGNFCPTSARLSLKRPVRTTTNSARKR